MGYTSGGHERTLLQGLSVVVFFVTADDRPLLRDRCYRTLPIWKITTVPKYDMQGLGGGGGGLLTKISRGGEFL
jgi:hypothetical protein